MGFHNTGLNTASIVSGIANEAATEVNMKISGEKPTLQTVQPGISRRKIERAAEQTIDRFWEHKLKWLKPYEQVLILEEAVMQGFPIDRVSVSVSPTFDPKEDGGLSLKTIQWTDVIEAWVKTGLAEFAAHTLATRIEIEEPVDPIDLSSDDAAPTARKDIQDLVKEISNLVAQKPDSRQRDFAQELVNDNPISLSRPSNLMYITAVLYEAYHIRDTTLIDQANRSNDDWSKSLYGMYGAALQHAVLEHIRTDRLP
jgi:hypothetical protein